MNETSEQLVHDEKTDTILSPEMALACEAAGAAKAGRDEIALVVLGLLGAFVALGSLMVGAPLGLGGSSPVSSTRVAHE